MSHKIDAQSLPITLRQKLQMPVHAKFIGVQLDIRHNNCLLWWLADDEAPKRENVEVIMLKLNESLDPPNAKFIGSFKDNSGMIHVFAIRDSERASFVVEDKK